MTAGEFGFLIHFMWVLMVFGGGCLLAYAGATMLINESRQKLALEAMLALIASTGGVVFLMTFLASPAVVTVYLFGLLIGIGGTYFGARYYALHRENSNQEAEESNTGHEAAMETSAAAVIGTITMLLLTLPDIAFPALAIGGGAIIAALVLFLINGRTYYAGGGTLYCGFTSGGIWLFGLPDAYAQSPFVVLLTLGGVSAIIVSIQLGVGIVLQRLLAGVTGEKTALRIYEAVAAILGLIAMIWAVINIHERATRYGGVTIGGTLGMVLNFLGIELPIPWIISDGVDASMVLYVGAVLIGFHTLESLHTTWHAAKQTAKSGVAAGKTASQKSANAASAARERINE